MSPARSAASAGYSASAGYHASPGYNPSRQVIENISTADRYWTSLSTLLE